MTYIFAPYPKWKYHATLPACLVHNTKEELRLGEAWGDAPADPEPEPVADGEEVLRPSPKRTRRHVIARPCDTDTSGGNGPVIS